MKYFFTVLFLGMISFFINAQIYTPFDTDDLEKRAKIAILYEEKSNEYLIELSKRYTGKKKKYIEKIHKEYFKDILSSIDDGEFIYDTQFSDKLEKIIDKLRINNPNIPNDINIWVSKSVSLNAYCMLDGTLIVNMGTFYWLNNEDQLAAIIAHELAHHILEHSLETILRDFDKHQNKKKEIKQIKRGRYNRNDRALSEFKRQIYATTEYKRLNEISADSLGYLIYKNSGKYKDSYLSNMKLVEEYRKITPKGVKHNIYKKLFDLPEQPFQEKWIQSQDFSSYNYENYQIKIDLDSVKTHPETIKRINILKNFFPELKDLDTIKVEATDEFKNLSYIAQMQFIPNLFDRKEYGIATYNCILVLQSEDLDDDTEKYFKYWLGKNFKALKQARKDYLFNRYVEQIDPNDENQSDSYKMFLNFIWNLNLSELKNIANYYLNN